MQVDLILWPGAEPNATPHWPAGRVYELPAEPAAAAERLARVLDESSAEYLLFWDAAFGAPSLERFEPETHRLADGIHGGLRLYLAGQPEALDYLISDWSWIDAPADRRSTSWRLSLRCSLLRTAAVRAVGGLDPAFETLEGAGLELGYRLLKRGAVLWYEPRVLAQAERMDPGRPPSLADAYVFVQRWFKPHWTRYLQARRMLAGVQPFREAQARSLAANRCRTYPAPDHSGVVRRAEAARRRPRISAIIPTLGRYPYVPAALTSLAEQTLRPDEVIVVDQNGAEERNPGAYEPYEDLGLRVIWQDERGQSLARNTAIAETTGDYVFLFDDDSVAQPDLIERHLRLLEAYGAHASTGVSIPPPPAEYVLPEDFRFPRIAQTFDSGNALLSRKALELVGGFDRSYDHGVNTDMDFGTRLYLAGGLIVHNPDAVRVHYKAPMGGLRVYGGWWAHTNNGLFRPFPPPTQMYYMLRFLTPRQRRERLLRFVAMSLVGWEKKQSHARVSRSARIAQSLLTLPLLPYRVGRSHAQARRLLREGPKIPAPPTPAVYTPSTPVASIPPVTPAAPSETSSPWRTPVAR